MAVARDAEVWIRGQKGALEAFDLRHQKIRVCIEKFEEFDARTGVG